MIESTQITAAKRRSSLPIVLVMVGVIVLLMVGGAFAAFQESKQAAPSLPAPPPGAHQLWASQTTDMLQGNQILSRALYRLNEPPSAVIAYYRRTLPDHGGLTGRFVDRLHSALPADQPEPLGHLPIDFSNADGSHANYTYTGYTAGTNDIGIAVDLRHPSGPTLVFVEMLSG